MIRGKYLVAIGLLLNSPVQWCATVEGTISGQDGKPLPASHVQVWTLGKTRELVKTVSSDAQGRFSLSIEDQKPQVLALTGVNSVPLRIPMFPEAGKVIHLEARLQPVPYFGDLLKVRLVQNFGEPDDGGLPSILLERMPNGDLSGELKNQSEDVVHTVLRSGYETLTPLGPWSYKLSGSTMSTLYGIYHASIPVKNGSARIHLRSRDFNRKPADAVLTMTGSSAPMRRLADHAAKFQSFCTRIANNKSLLAGYSVAPVDRYISLNGRDVWWREQLDDETDPLVRQFLVHSLLYLVQLESPDKVRQRLVELEQLLEQMPITSVFWAEIFPECNDDKVLPRMLATHPDSQKVRDYFFKFLREDAGDELKMRSVLLALDTLNVLSGARFSELYALLVKEFPDAPFTLEAKKRFHDDFAPVVQVGKKIPAFSVRSLNDPNVEYSDRSLLSKIYLIDMWATWCGICLGDTATLHEMYKRYRSEGFQILGLSLDSEIEHLTRFQREGKHPMPWLHAWVAKGSGQEKIITDFGNDRGSAPRYFLVDENGIVLARDKLDDVRKKLKERFDH